MQLYHVRHRCYDAKIGTWISRDPAGYTDGMNLYEYVKNSPVGFTDPYGLALYAAPEGVHLTVDLLGLIPGAGDYIDIVHGVSYFLEGRIADGMWSMVAAIPIIGTPVAMFAKRFGVVSKVIDAVAPFVKKLQGGLDYLAQKAKSFVARIVSIVTPPWLKKGWDWLKRKAGRFVKWWPWGGCFVAGTLVMTPAGATPIEDVEVGQRVLTTALADSTQTEVDSETWCKVTLQVVTADGHIMVIEWLRPLQWVAEHQCIPGRMIDLALMELGYMGPAVVIAIEPCPSIEPGPGNVVLGTFTILADDVIRIDLEGATQPIKAASSHRLFSADRNNWVAVAELSIGDRLRTRSGSVRIDDINVLSGSHRVFNLDVETDHQYFVTSLELLSHNDSAFSKGNRVLDPPKIRNPDADARDVAATAFDVCFVAGTPVATVDGLHPIETIQAGALVWSYDVESDQWDLYEVIQPQSRVYDGEAVSITLTNEDGDVETIQASASHPFWITSGDALDVRPCAFELTVKEQAMTLNSHGGRWVECRHLQRGDILLAKSGKETWIIEVTICNARFTVYNLAVQNQPTYAVGHNGVLVHNNNCFTDLTIDGKSIPDYNASRGGRPGTQFNPDGTPKTPFEQLEQIKKAQERNRKAIESTRKSEQRAKNFLRDCANDPSLLDELD